MNPHPRHLSSVAVRTVADRMPSVAGGADGAVPGFCVTVRHVNGVSGRFGVTR
jgi:hypothetical protein